MGASSSTCSSSAAIHGGKYGLFVSFRGEDVRYSFKSHFCEALIQKQIGFFADDKLKRGDEIWPALSKAIEDSDISVVIFSEYYASSKWCMRELVRILECKEKNGQIVIPVFYHVDPSDVRNQTGSFEDAFVKNHENISEDEKQIWRAALTEASNLAGFDSSAIRPESKLVQEIVKDILKKLKDISPSSDLDGLVGIRSRIERVKQLLYIEKSNFEIVGIWGMGGIGKTTIAKAVFNQIYGQFDCHHFIANVREESERCNGLVRLQKMVLSKILEEYVDFFTPNISQFNKYRLKHKKVRIILDDVNSLEQLETLAEGIDGFGPGSRIIITTRDRHLLHSFGVNNIYEVEAFNDHEALQLFCKYALKENNPPNREGLMLLAHKFVIHAKGNPLALKVVGSFLYGRERQCWESALNRLQDISNPKIHNLLQLSYDELDYEEKNIFLDIACLFKGDYKDFVIQILDGCSFSTQMVLSVLVDKSLITISQDKIEMHDLLQIMGREMVHRESVNEGGKRSRLYHHNDIYHVLQKNMGTAAVETITLDMSKINDLYISSQVFAETFNLRFLKFYNPTQGISKVHGPGLECLPEKLGYLYWDRYPYKALPSSFSLDMLVQLNLSESNLKILWEGKKEAPRLQVLVLSNSRHLTRIPEFSHAPFLENIFLDGCRSLLEDSRSSLQNLENLHYLSLDSCEKFRSFPNISGEIQTLDLSGTAIQEVPSSIGSLTRLSYLYFTSCARLKLISPGVCKLKSLLYLSFWGCSKLKTFPEILEIMESLEQLDLSKTAIKGLPLSIENLNGLLELRLSHCENLEMLPSSICNLRFLRLLNVSDCSKLEKLPENLENLQSLEHLNAAGTALCRLPSSLTSLEKLQHLKCSRCKGLTLPPMSGLLHSLRKLNLKDCNMTKIPEDIGCLSSLYELELNGNDFESLPTSIKQLSKLRRLHLNNCSSLQSLCDLPLGLPYLEAVNCKQLQSLPNASHFAESVIECGFYGERLEYMFTNCVKLDEKVFSNVLKESLLKIQHEKSLGTIMDFMLKGYQQKVDFSICFPGSYIPKGLSYQSFGSSVKIQLPLDNWGNRKLLGFALWAVLVFDGFRMNHSSAVSVDYKCCFGTEHYVIFGGRLTVTRAYENVENVFIDSDHVLLGYHDCSDYVNLFSDHDCTSCSFEFSFPPGYHPKCQVKCCGVHPIHRESIQSFGGPDDPNIICTESKFAELCALCAEPNITDEAHIKTRKFPDEADTSARESGDRFNPKSKSAHFINNKVSLLHRTLLKGVDLLHCYFWSFIVCLFGGLYVFGLLGLLLLYLSTSCEIYLSYHAQNM